METSGKKKPTAVIKPHLKPQAGYDSQNKNQPQAWSANQNRTGGGYQSRGGGATNQHPATMVNRLRIYSKHLLCKQI